MNVEGEERRLFDRIGGSMNVEGEERRLFDRIGGSMNVSSCSEDCMMRLSEIIRP
jgi:hypothetical protein